MTDLTILGNLLCTIIAGDVFTNDKAQDLASARALRARDPSMLVVGHGGAVRNPGSQMDTAIRRAEG